MSQTAAAARQLLTRYPPGERDASLSHSFSSVFHKCFFSLSIPPANSHKKRRKCFIIYILEEMQRWIKYMCECMGHCTASPSVMPPQPPPPPPFFPSFVSVKAHKQTKQ